MKTFSIFVFMLCYWFTINNFYRAYRINFLTSHFFLKKEKKEEVLTNFYFWWFTKTASVPVHPQCGPKPKNVSELQPAVFSETSWEYMVQYKYSFLEYKCIGMSGHAASCFISFGNVVTFALNTHTHTPQNTKNRFYGHWQDTFHELDSPYSRQKVLKRWLYTYFIGAMCIWTKNMFTPSSCKHRTVLVFKRWVLLWSRVAWSLLRQPN